MPTSTGVRGIRLIPGDAVISMSILHRVGTTQEEREAYLRFAPWKGEKEGECSLPADRIADLNDGTVHPDRLRQRLRQALLGL